MTTNAPPAASTPPASVTRAWLASPFHLTVVLLIVSTLTISGALQSHAAARGAAAPPVPDASGSRLLLYTVLIGLQALWVRYVSAGMKRRGRTLSELIGTMREPVDRWLRDLLFGVLGFAMAGLAGEGVKAALGGVSAQTAFLLPHGVLEAVVWVGLSITAGISEEIVFRGYLQRQFTAITGSVAAAVLLQAALFGASHGYQGLKPMLTTGTFGLVMGLLAWWRRDVRASALAHAMTDIVGGLVR